MKMRILGIIFAIFMTGCASTYPEAYMNTTSPIFILNKPDTRAVFVNFRDYKDGDNINEVIAKTLQNANYNILFSDKNASIIIRGGINYFKENANSNTHGYVGVGFGFGSHGRRSKEIGFGLSHRFTRGDFYDEYSQTFSGQASLLLRVKSKDKFENYSTNLNFQTDDNSYTYSYAKSLFNRQIAQKILEFLEFKMNSE